MDPVITPYLRVDLDDNLMAIVVIIMTLMIVLQYFTVINNEISSLVIYYTYDAFDIADLSSMQDACHI